jgi:hypothetical protein
MEKCENNLGVWRNVRTTWENIVESESEKEYNSSLSTFK